jgi:hypothetical protein
MQTFLLVPPGVYLGFVLSTFATFLFHAMAGRRRRSGLFYWPFGLSGFAAGALASASLGADYLMIGGLPVLGALVGCLIGLLLAHLLLT